MQDALAVLVLLAGFLSSCAALPILIKPSWLRFRHRIYALPAALGFVGASGLVMIFFPPFATGQGEIDSRAGGLGLLLLWCVGAAIAALIARPPRPASETTPLDAPPIPNDTDEGAAEAIRRHRQLVNEMRGMAERYPISKRPVEPVARIADRGSWARFEYVDRDGVVTQRRISNWRRDGVYITGWCNTRREERTFRLDRMDEWVAG